ncbi:hypothetical protein BAU67_001867 [Escherichia coli]|nr:hypothetical protein [Escherichia coli]
MTKPAIPLDIWASQEVVLENTGELNKSQPEKDLRTRGWDMSQRPACEIANFEFHMLTAWLKHMTEEVVPGWDDRFLRVTNNLADVPDKAAARKALGVYSPDEMDDLFVDKAGDTLTQSRTLGVPRINFASANTDKAAIYATAGKDKTTLDFWAMDNIGGADGADLDDPANQLDGFRWRFQPTGGNPVFSAMKLNAITASRARLSVTGSIECNDMKSYSFNANTATMPTAKVTGQQGCGGANVGRGVDCNDSTVRGQYAVVGGRNVVRGVNGKSADASGNLTIPLPSRGVDDLRIANRFKTTYRASTVYPGHVMLSGNYAYKHPYQGDYWTGAIQKLVNGQWITISYA